MLPEPARPFYEDRQTLDHLRLDHGGGSQGEQANQGAHLQTDGVAIREAQHIVEKAIVFIPQLVRLLANAVHSRVDPQKMLVELAGYPLVARVVESQFQGQLQHHLRVESHPDRAIRLLQVAAGGQRRAAVKDADVVQPQKAALKDVMAVQILAVHPPGEIQHELVEGVRQKVEVALAARLLLVCSGGSSG